MSNSVKTIGALFLRHWTFLVLFLVLLPVIFPILHPGMLVTGDGMGHLFRQVSYHKAFTDGQIPPRWSPLSAHGFGAPIFLYIWYLPYLAIEGLILLGLSTITSVKIFNIFCLLVGPLGMYFWMRKLTGKLPALAAGVLYGWAPYRLMATFLYGGWGDMLAMTIAPYLGMAAGNLAEKPSRRNWFLLIFLVAALISAHNLSSFIYLPTIFLFTLARIPNLKVLARLALAYLGGVGLTAFFWLPSLTLNRLIAFNWNAYFWSALYEHFPSLPASLAKAWAQFASPVEKVWYYDFSLGLPYLIVLLASPFFLMVSKKATKRLLAVAILLGAGAYFLTLDISKPVWLQTPLKIFLLSYRFYSPATFFLTIAAAISLSHFSKKALLGLAILVIPFAMQAGRLYLHPATGYADITEKYLSQPQPSRWAPGTTIVMGTMEFLPRWVSESFAKELDLKSEQPKILPEGQIRRTEILTDKTALLRFSYTSDSLSAATISRFYFPNWKAKVNNKPVEIKIDEVGRMKLMLPEAKNGAVATIFWTTSEIEKLGIAISVISFIIIIGWLLKPRQLKAL